MSDYTHTHTHTQTIHVKEQCLAKCCLEPVLPSPSREPPPSGSETSPYPAALPLDPQGLLLLEAPDPNPWVEHSLLRALQSGAPSSWGLVAEEVTHRP